MTCAPLIDELSSGPVDVVGDVHGELGPLQDLLKTLGYEPDGRHPERRRLVFLGDLTDRGPDSPGVVRLVRDFVRAGRAQCILGNHELNILRRDPKPDNQWFFAQTGELDEPPPADQSLADTRAAEEIYEFFSTLPLALEREDLRVVHACWHEPAISELRPKRGDVCSISKKFKDSIRVERPPLSIRVDLEDPNADVGALSELAPEIARANVRQQNENPVKVLTSGLEESAAEPFFSGHRWRFQHRRRWWNDYSGPMVVIGHYWRSAYAGESFSKGIDPFAGCEPEAPLGPQGRVMCVDYSIGRRPHERRQGLPFKSALAAFRWPEQQLVFV